MVQLIDFLAGLWAKLVPLLVIAALAPALAFSQTPPASKRVVQIVLGLAMALAMGSFLVTYAYLQTVGLLPDLPF
jgi:hypothetical protein